MHATELRIPMTRVAPLLTPGQAPEYSAGVLDVDLFRQDPNARPMVQGEELFAFGDAGHEMFVVTRGQIELRLPGGEPIEVVGPGGLLGEMALIDGSPRTATATALSPAEIVPLSRARFAYLTQNTPYFALALMGVMARRLRRMNEARARKLG
jgi:CRP/FNR family transcriptional regulator, cyclic AMP receptor protein